MSEGLGKNKMWHRFLHSFAQQARSVYQVQSLLLNWIKVTRPSVRSFRLLHFIFKSRVLGTDVTSDKKRYKFGLGRWRWGQISLHDTSHSQEARGGPEYKCVLYPSRRPAASD